MSDNSSIAGMIKESLESIGKMIKCETVMGEMIVTPQGTSIIPVSKVALGYGSGGVDYNNKKNAAKLPPEDSDFAGGGGLGLSLTPLGFLVIDSEGRTDFLSIVAANNVPKVVNIIDTAVDLIERSPEIAEKLKKVFEKKEKRSDGESE